MYCIDRLKLRLSVVSKPEVIQRLDRPDKSEPRVGIHIYGARNEPVLDGFKSPNGSGMCRELRLNKSSGKRSGRQVKLSQEWIKLGV